MTKLVTTFLLVIGFVFCVQSFTIPNDLNKWLNVYDELGMFKNTGTKHVKYLGLVYPSPQIKFLGQVGGLDTLSNGNLLVFHRGGQVWSGDSFVGNTYNTKKYGAIKSNTIALIDAKSMEIVDSWGKDMFYMPHGLTVDHNGKVWLTDVGLHQVFKFDLNNMDKPELVLGEAFRYGDDAEHFCKPTDVAVAKSNGHVFVSDGYCNQRIVEFDENGKFVKTFEDAKKPLFIVHSITLIDDLNLVCTVSREQGRIVCFDIESGKKLKQEIVHDHMKTVYAIKYDPNSQVLHAATGENHNSEAVGLTFDVSQENFGKFIQEWSAKDRDLAKVHDITISPKGSRIFLGQLNGEIDEMKFE